MIVDPKINPIYYTKEEMKKSSKWKRYIKRIHDVALWEMPQMCLIKKTNNAYCYHSNYNNCSFVFECRYEGNHEKRECTACIYNQNEKVFHKTTKTPKKLYNKLIKFIYFDDLDTKTNILDLREKWVYKGLFVFSKLYAELKKRDAIKSFVSSDAKDISTFINFEKFRESIVKEYIKKYEYQDEFYEHEW